MERLYADDKPKNCRFCYWWDLRKKSCILTEERCYYRISKPERGKGACAGCPYGIGRPCVGYCMRKLLGQPGV